MGKHRVKRQPIVQRACGQCGADFLVAPNHIAKGGGKYCSRKCMGQAQTARMPVYTCQCCGKVFKARKRKTPRQYCSRECAGKVKRLAVKKPFVSRPYQHEKWAMAVILRDKKCSRCGTVENLQAHHLKSWKGHPELRFDLSNGTTLCPLCHHAQHPYLPLEGFVVSGGKSVRYCVVCETAYLVKRKTQRTCSRKCGWERKRLMGGGSSQVNGQTKQAMGRRPA
jgi:5-methylcytosine-specific restriction endonuclease McrA